MKVAILLDSALDYYGPNYNDVFASVDDAKRYVQSLRPGMVPVWKFDGERAHEWDDYVIIETEPTTWK